MEQPEIITPKALRLIVDEYRWPIRRIIENQLRVAIAKTGLALINGINPEVLSVQENAPLPLAECEEELHRVIHEGEFMKGQINMKTWN